MGASRQIGTQTIKEGVNALFRFRDKGSDAFDMSKQLLYFL
jgi:hypothetical protein